METAKKGSLSGLLYRELYMGRKDLITAVIFFAGVALFCLMVLLSFEYGNLGRAMNSVIDSMRDEESRQNAIEGFENAKRSMMLMIKLLPVVMGCQFNMAANNVTARDELASWQRFSRCAPVTPVRRALIKTIMNALCCLVPFGIGSVYISAVGAVSGTGSTGAEYAVAFCAVTLLAAFSVIGQIFIMLFHSADRGYLVLLTVIAVPTLLISFINSMNESAAPPENKDIVETLTAFCTGAAPFIPLIISGLLLISFAAFTVLYSRREK